MQLPFKPSAQLAAISAHSRVKAKLREDRQMVTRRNETWLMDFVPPEWSIAVPTHARQ
jgi:hypothetical protein